MRYLWDETKRQRNLQKHGLDFEDVGIVLDGFCTETLDDREEYGEDRWLVLGMLGPIVVLIVYAEDADSETRRIISFRKATRRERETYEREISNRLGPG